MPFTVVATPSRPGYEFKTERAAFEQANIELQLVNWESEDQYIQAARHADAVISGMRVSFTARVISGLTQCKVLINGGVGVDRIDVEAATAAGIPVVNVPDVWINEVADHAMMLVLAAARKLPHGHKVASEGRWGEVHNGLSPLPRLQGRTLGLIAFGSIARSVAKRAQAFGINVIAFDPYVTSHAMSELGVGSRSLEALLAESDFVSAHAPYTAGTHHLMGAAQFALMKPSAIFVNTGRGGVVDEAALIEALQRGTIAAAGLDVLEQEPPEPDNPLLTMPNVIVTPHVAYYSDEAFAESRVRVAEEVLAVLNGKRPRNIVNPAVLERLSLT